MPKYTIRITAADKLHVQESDTTILSVQFDILRDDDTIETLRHGFPLDTSGSDVESELQKVLDAYIQDAQTAESKAVYAQADAQADATIAEIVGKEISN